MGAQTRVKWALIKEPKEIKIEDMVTMQPVSTNRPGDTLWQRLNRDRVYNPAVVEYQRSSF